MVLVALVVTGACGVSGLSFKTDDRVDIVRPDARAKVRLPTTVTWTVKDFAVGPGQGSFGVFLDRSPQRSGKTLAWLFRGDKSCKGTEGRALCQTTDFLAQRGVYRTDATQFTVEQVQKLSGNERSRQFHELTVILLDRDGNRVGEGAWSVQFEVPKH